MRVAKLVIICCYLNINNVFAQPGDLDSSFSYDGIATLPDGGARSVVLQPDGKVILGGGWNNFSLVRFNIDGNIDSSFGINGVATTIMGVGSNAATGIVLQPDGKILESGSCLNNSGVVCFALARFNNDGSLDNTFNGNGKVLTSFNDPAIQDDGRTVALQPDGKIIQVGRGQNGMPTTFFATVRFNSNGSVDNSFGNAGKVLTYVGPNPYPDANCITLQVDGKILVGGMSWSNASPSSFALVRYNANGSLDNTFGTGGKVSTYFGDGSSNDLDVGKAIAIQPDGKILMTGNCYVGGIPIVRYNADGSLDNSFGINGKVITLSETIGGYQCNSVTLQPDGKILIAGNTYYDLGGEHNDMMLARYYSNGTLDSSFGKKGIVITSVSSESDAGASAVMQQDGKIVVGGYSQEAGWIAARFLSGLNVGVLNLSIPANSLLIYPNPIRSEAMLQYTLTNEECVYIALYNLQGVKVQTFLTGESQNQGEHKEVLNLEEALPSGEYILSISNIVHSQSIKIVKE